jgi:tetratricopeptide (TPR) repeat protein
LLDRLSKTAPNKPVVQEALGHKALSESNYDDAVIHLTAALPLDEAIVYADLSAALLHLGREGEAVDYLKKAAEIEPFNAVTQKTLILSYIHLKRYTEAQEAMMRYVNRFPEDAFMRNLLERVDR